MKILKRLLVLLAIALSFCVGAIVNSICSIAQLEELAKAEGVTVHYVTAEKMLEEKEKYSFNKTLHGLYFSNEKKDIHS